MNEAGIALGAVSLVAQLFVGCANAYSLISIAQGTGEDISISEWKLRIEESRFKIWGRAWGLGLEMESQGYSGKFLMMLTRRKDWAWKDVGGIDSGIFELVTGLFQKIKDILDDTTVLKTRYGIAPLGASQQVLVVNDIESSRTRVPRRPLATQSAVSKTRWAITDKHKFEQLLGDLKYFNDSLYSLLPISQRQSLEIALPSQFLSNLSLSPPELGIIKAAAHDRYRDLSITATLRAAGIQYSVPSGDVAGLHLKRTDIEMHASNGRGKPLSGFLKRGDGHYRQIIIEWKCFDDEDMRGETGFVTTRRLDDLANLLNKNPKPEGFRVLDCIGYFNDYEPGRVGFVFDIPPHVIGNMWTTTSLFDMLSSERVPELGYRFALAQSLSSTIMQIHAAGWLHKSIRSQNVLFFYAGAAVGGTQNFDPHSPYLVGFDVARLDGSNEISPDADRSANLECDIYRHPNCQGALRKRHTMAYDRFSLGLILLEIGLWRQLRTFWKTKYTPEKFLNRLLEYHVMELDSKMGRTYQAVVRGCLSLEVGGTEDGGETTGDVFYWRVVKPLESCRV